MAIQYYMRAFNTNSQQYVDWIVNDTPDSTGQFSGFPSNQLINITVNRVVQSKVANFLKPNQSLQGTDGYYFHVNAYDWKNAVAPLGPPTNLTGFAVERGITSVANVSTASNTTPITVTTATNHGLTTGQLVTIIGVTGNLNANGTFPITVTSLSTFTLNGSTGSGTPNPGTGIVFVPNSFSDLMWDENSQLWRFVFNTNGDGVTLGASQNIKFNAALVDGYIALGSPTASQGIIRLPDNQYIFARDSLNNNDVQLLGLDAFPTSPGTNRIKLGATTTDFVYMPGNLGVDGYIQHNPQGGLIASTNAFINDKNNTTIVGFRNQPGTADIAALGSTTTNNIVLGDAVNATIQYNTATGGIHQFQVNSVPEVEIGLSFIRFPGAVVLPTIFQNTAAINNNGQALTIQAQNATTTGTGAGGALNLTSGSGATGQPNGVVNVQTAGVTRIIVSDSTETYNIPNIQFASSVPAGFFAGPSISQAITAAAAAQPLTIAAQTSSNGLGVGGNLVLTSGMGGLAQNDGYVILQSAGITQMIVSAFNYPAHSFPTSSGKVTITGNLEVQGTLTTVDSTTVDIVGAVIHGNWSDPVTNPNVGIPITVVGYASHRGNLNGVPRDGASLIWTEGPTANNSTYGVTATTATTDGTLYASDGYWRAISTPGDGFGVDGYTAANSLASVGVLANNFVSSVDPNPIPGTVPGSGGLRATNDTSAVTARSLAPSTTLTVAGTTPTTLPTGTLNVVSTTGFGTNFTTPSGSLLVNTSAGPQFAAYTGTTGTSFTGVTWPFLIGTPTISTGGIVGQTNPFTTIVGVSNGITLPQTTISVVSTVGFPQSGTLRVVTWGPTTPGVPANGSGVQNVTYSGISGNQFTGCSGGTGTMWTGNPVALAPIVGTFDLPLVGTDFGNRVLHGLSDGYAGITANNTGHIFNTATVASTPTSGLYDFWVNSISQVQLASTVVGGDGYTQSIAVSPTVSTPKIFQLVQPYTGANSGFNMLLQAQAGQLQTGGANNNNGGNLTLASGIAGTGGGGTAGLNGVVTINVGSVNNSTFNNADPDADGYVEWLAVGPTVGSAAVGGTGFRLYQATLPGTGTSNGFNFKINAQAGQAVAGGTNNNGGNLVLASGTPGTGGTAGTPGQMEFFYGSTLELTLTDGSLQWSNLITNPPTISQAGGVTNGQTMTIQAQNATATGGALTLTSGSGTTNGNVNIQTGGGTRVLVTTSFTAFNDSTATEALRITPASAGTTFITFAATDTGATINQTTTGGATGAPMTIQAQNAATTGGALNFTTGTGATNPGNMTFQIGGTTLLTLFNTAATPNTLQWLSTTTSPVFNQGTTGGASGQTLTIQAQNAATTGGNLALTSGTGTTAGNVVLETGGTPRVTVTPTNTQFADTATALTITPLSAGNTQITFASTDTAATIQQATTVAATGATMTVAAQSAATTGGNLFLTSGFATTDGYVALQTGGTTVASAVPNKFVFNQGRRRHVTSINTTYQVLVTDDFVAITSISAPFTITMPSAPTLGDTYTFKDASGTAATNNVTISGNGTNIDGTATITLSQNYAAVVLTFTGTTWSIS